ncbi:hypothetical protein PFHG_05456 [Plasmodium falciparum HB3]|uniref:Rifin n=1 Tax=Plasmodium falciparum (isolate HB3) TaxID=137071 RepID=A0A0L7KL45_PLAFX|nr:hypothetical protein PFHG_05456 [Plasmodium falciparum HB3]
MKRVMQQFHDRITQRFQEYDEKLQEKRQKCKEQCDKEIQKIILKDKIEKELTEKFATLQTDIQSDAIPTCVCEKSIADKVEKGCLRCGYGLGSVAPMIGLTGSVAVNVWKTTEIAAVIAAAEKFGAAKGAAAGLKAGVDAVISKLSSLLSVSTIDDKALGLVINATNYNNTEYIFKAIYNKFRVSCLGGAPGPGGFTAAPTDQAFCNTVDKLVFGQGKVRVQTSIPGSIQKAVNQIVTEAKSAAVSETANVTTRQTAVFESRNLAAVNATYASSQTAIIASVVAILVIVLVMKYY